ncbi:hypothetical protein B0J11DRAFT_583766 [Dendryphion nanum]|uniref:Uncharacterized protein n=1 Tax=Dendryphion nanum TaxID=256645 RepID=A0A9P9DCY6_9PLEO|nr:hypothetical protein B0J11DRAFT_583766 [Dendryphion nanum]
MPGYIPLPELSDEHFFFSLESPDQIAFFTDRDFPLDFHLTITPSSFPISETSSGSRSWTPEDYEYEFPPPSLPSHPSVMPLSIFQLSAPVMPDEPRRDHPIHELLEGSTPLDPEDCEAVLAPIGSEMQLRRIAELLHLAPAVVTVPLLPIMPETRVDANDTIRPRSPQPSGHRSQQETEQETEQETRQSDPAPAPAPAQPNPSPSSPSPSPSPPTPSFPLHPIPTGPRSHRQGFRRRRATYPRRR